MLACVQSGGIIGADGTCIDREEWLKDATHFVDIAFRAAVYTGSLETMAENACATPGAVFVAERA